MKLIPRRWADFQHYKNRRPPWIKLHKALLDDREYQRLPLASRALAPMLWLLASESKDGVFEAATEELTFRLRQPAKDIDAGLSSLIEAGFFMAVQTDSTLLADRQQLAVPEERRGETEKEGAKESPIPNPASTCPQEEIRQLWAEKVPNAVQPRTWTGARSDALKARWREDCKRQSLEWWAGLFDHIADSNFLMGRTSSPGRTPFLVSLDWLVKAENFAKTLDGHYDNKEPHTTAIPRGGL